MIGGRAIGTWLKKGFITFSILGLSNNALAGVFPILSTNETRLALKNEQVREIEKEVIAFHTSEKSDANIPRVAGNEIRIIEDYHSLDGTKSAKKDLEIEDFELIGNTVKTEAQSIPLDELIKKQVKDQIRESLKEAAYSICLKEKCGKVLCVDVVKWKKIKDQYSGDYYFTQILCTDSSQEAVFRRGGSSFSSSIYKKTVLKKQESARDLTQEASTPEADKNIAKSPQKEEQKYNIWGLWTKYSQRAKQFGEVGKKVGSDVVYAVYHEATNNRSVFDPNTYNIFSYLGTAMTAAFASAVTEGYSQFQGVKAEDVNLGAVIDLAKVHLEKGKNTFTEDQKKVASNWIQDANKKLQEFAAAREKGLADIANTAAKAAENTTIEKKDGTDNKAVPAPPPLPMPQTAPKVTLKSVIERTQSAVAGKKPTRDILEKENKELLNLLLALSEFLMMPYEIQQTNRETVDKRYSEDIFIGSRIFKKDLHGRSQMIAENAFKKTFEQNKKILLAVSGPGTIKTTGIKSMAKWANVPICTLTGEELNTWVVPNGRTIFDLLVDWMKKCVTQYSRIEVETENEGKKSVTAKKVINGLFFFDDWHYALDPKKGLLAKDQISRQKFFSLLKNLGDPNQDSVISIELAPGKLFPLNLSRYQVVITANELFPEFDPKTGDPPLLSRLVNLNAAYPDEEDRKERALSYLPNLKAEIEKKFKEQNQKDFDEQECHDRLLDVAQVDIEIFDKQFGRHLGMRGLMELLDKYKQHVLSKLNANTYHANICSFAGDPPFDPRIEVTNIFDYQKQVNQDLAHAEVIKKMKLKISEIRLNLSLLSSLNQELIEALLKKADSDEHSLSERQKAFEEASFNYNILSKKLEIPSPLIVGQRLKNQFGYFQAEGKDSNSSSGEADRFTPLVRVAEDIYTRIAAARAGRFLPNHLVRVSYTDPSAKDDSLFKTLGNILGGFPVCQINQVDLLMQAPKDIYGVSDYDTNLKNLAAEVQGYTISIEGISGSRTFESLRIGTNWYYYQAVSNSGAVDYMLATIEGLKEARTSINSRQYSIKKQSAKSILGLDRSAQDAIRSVLHPKPMFWDNCIKQFLNTQSPGEGFIVIYLNPNLIQSIQKWVSLQSNPQNLDPIEYFEKYIYDQVNSETVLLDNGSSFDPRQMTVFLIHETASVRKKTEDLGKEIAINLIQGPPPIEGRKHRAESLLSTELALLQEQVLKSGIPKPADFKVSLTEVETSIFNQLVAWDQESALRAKQVGYILPLLPLDGAVRDLVGRVRLRVMDYFGLGVKFPTLEVFQAEWKEHYKTYVEEMERIVRQREEEARRIEHERNERIAREAALRAEEERRLAQEKAAFERMAQERALRQQQQYLYNNQGYIPPATNLTPQTPEMRYNFERPANYEREHSPDRPSSGEIHEDVM